MRGPCSRNNNNDQPLNGGSDQSQSLCVGGTMVDVIWLYVAAVGGAVLGMLLFAVMTMAADEPLSEVGSASDALT